MVISFDAQECARAAAENLPSLSWNQLGASSECVGLVEVDRPVDADELFETKWLSNDPSGKALEDPDHPNGVCTFFVKLNWCVTADLHRGGAGAHGDLPTNAHATTRSHNRARERASRRCTFGERCRYWHPGCADRGASPVSPPMFPRRPGAPACTHYLRTGKCSYGPGCKFDHPGMDEEEGMGNRMPAPFATGELAPADSNAAEDCDTEALVANATPPLAVPECRFHALGRCELGSRCAFRHVATADMPAACPPAKGRMIPRVFTPPSVLGTFDPGEESPPLSGASTPDLPEECDLYNAAVCAIVAPAMQPIKQPHYAQDLARLLQGEGDDEALTLDDARAAVTALQSAKMVLDQKAPASETLGASKLGKTDSRLATYTSAISEAQLRADVVEARRTIQREVAAIPDESRIKKHLIKQYGCEHDDDDVVAIQQIYRPLAAAVARAA